MPPLSICQAPLHGITHLTRVLFPLPFILPSMRVLPAAKKETRWEKFAKEKGIQNRKRARMLWDEEAQEWRPRWGYKRAKGGVEEQAIVEVKEVSACGFPCVVIVACVRVYILSPSQTEHHPSSSMHALMYTQFGYSPMCLFW